MIVKATLEKLHIAYTHIDLGEIHLVDQLTEPQLTILEQMLLPYGLVLMNDKKAILIEKIKNIIIEMIHYEEDLQIVKNSTFISEKIGQNYTYLANLFSETTGTTIEHFILLHKIEKVKELIIYNELNLTQIADKMHYSSVAHLSNQFKKITGLTPTFYKRLKSKKRTPLEDI
jgi:AraC-like DNA-binding protein